MAVLSNHVIFTGNVYPAGLKISIGMHDITFAEGKGLFTARITVDVVDSAITIHCYFDNILQDHPYSLWAQAQEITQTLVNLVAFKMGVGAITILNHWVNERGESNTLALGDPLLPVLCTAFNAQNFPRIVNQVFSEPGLFMALNDLVLANAMPRHVLINCARGVEAVRHLIAPPGTSRNQAWAMMREALNLDEAYLTFITSASVEPRHGKQTEFNDASIREARVRTWTIMDRFLHYRLNGDQPLSDTAFPLLRG